MRIAVAFATSLFPSRSTIAMQQHVQVPAVSRLFTASALLSLTAGLSLAQLAPQVHPITRRGMFSAAPLAMVLDPNVNPAHPTGILVREPGTAPATPAPWSTARFGAVGAEYPDYSMSAIFGANASVVKLTGVSSGNDIMPPLNSEGSFVFETDSPWFALTVSVKNSSVGAAGTHPDRLWNAGDRPGAELFTYYFDGSIGISSVLVGTVTSEQSREMLGFVPEPNPALRADVAALDYGIGFISYDRAGRVDHMFPVRDRIYFTLDQSCVAALGANFAIGPNGAYPAEPSAIYVSEWTWTNGQGTWSQPALYRSWQELGIQPATQLDMIVIDHHNEREIFSIAGGSVEEQLKVRQQSPLVGPTALKSGSALVVQKIGLVHGDDIDSGCGIDPEAFEDWSPNVGTPVGHYSSPGGRVLGLSAVQNDRALSPAGGTAPPLEPWTPDYVLHLAASGTEIGANLQGAVRFLAAAAPPDAKSLPPLPSAGSPWVELGWVFLAPGQLEAGLEIPLGAAPLILPVDFVAELWTLAPGGNLVRDSWSVVSRVGVEP
jgi:hypothetical protein